MKEPLQHWTGLLENGDCATLCVEFWGIRVVFPFVCFAWRWKGWHTHTHMLASAQHPKPLAYCIHQAQKYQNAYETHLSAWYMHFMACRMPFSSIIFMWIGLNRMAPFRGKKLCLSHLGTPGMAASPFAVLHHTPQGTSAETCRCDAIIWHY